MKDLQENLVQYLLKPGQLVYLQSTSFRGRQKKVEVHGLVDDRAIDFFSGLHGKLINTDDLNEAYDIDDTTKEKPAALTHLSVSNGTNGIVVACFHWGHTEKQIQKFLDENKIESAEEAKPDVYCVLLLNDQLALAHLSICNPVAS